MADRTLTINHADGGSETYTINRDKFAGVREMSRGHVYPALVLTEQNQPYYNVTKTDDRNFRVVSTLGYDGEDITKFLSITPLDLRMGKHRVAFDVTVNSGDISNFQLRFSYRDPQTNLQPIAGSNTFDIDISDDGIPDGPNIYFAFHQVGVYDVTISNLKVTHEPDTVTVDHTATPKAQSKETTFGGSKSITIKRDIEPLLSKVVGGASAAYSLRDLNDKANTSKVVRVRRESDNNERDFNAKEVSNGTLQNWTNAQVTPPLDLRELTATGRDGPLIPAAAAYSLRNLSDSYTGSVVDVRRSSDSAVRSFTAAEVTDGTLLDWVNADVVTYTSDFSAGTDGWTFSGDGSVAGNIDGIGGLDDNLRYTIGVGASVHRAARFATLTGGFQYSTTIQVYIPSSNVNIDGYQMEDGGGNIISTSASPTLDTWLNVSGSWTQATGGIYIGGLKAGATSFTGNGTDVFYVRNVVFTQTTADGHVSTWYDQSGNTKHATQGTPASQPKIVDAGVLVTGGLDFDGTAFFSTSLVPTSAATLIGVATWEGAGGMIVGARDSQNERSYISATSSLILGVGPNNLSGGSITLEDESLVFGTYSGTTANASLNGVNTAFTGITAPVNTTYGYRIGALNSSGANINTMDGRIREVIIYPSDQSDNRTAFESNIGEVYGIAGIPAYANTVNGFVETWYDQSGNGNNATQAVASYQPKIVDAGVLVTDRDGKVALNGKGAKLDLPNDVPMLSADGTYSLFTVVDFDDQRNGNDQYNNILRFDSKTNGGASSRRKPLFYLNQSNGLAEATGPSYNQGSVYIPAAETLSVQLLTNIANPALPTGNNTLYADGALVSSSNTATSVNTETRLQIDSQIFDNQETTVTNFLSEVIYYPSDQSANRAAIEANINNQYGIY